MFEMAFIIFLFMLPSLTLTKINIQMTGTFDPDESELKVDYSGSDDNVISDEEVQTFKLSDSNVKTGVKNYIGCRPDDVYLHSPTPWGDLYKVYHWKEVTRTLKPIDAKMSNIDFEYQVIVKHDFINNSSVPGIYNVALSHSVQDTVSNSWSKTGNLTTKMGIGYNFEIGILNTGGYISMSYESSWGTNAENKQTVIIGATSSVTVSLQPGQTITAELHAQKATIKAIVEYEASVSGEVVANYADTYQGHHFWNLSVPFVMTAAKIKNKIKSTETINLGFYGKCKILIIDKVDPSKVTEFDLADLSKATEFTVIKV